MIQAMCKECKLVIQGRTEEEVIRRFSKHTDMSHTSKQRGTGLVLTFLNLEEESEVESGDIPSSE